MEEIISKNSEDKYIYENNSIKTISYHKNKRFNNCKENNFNRSSLIQNIDKNSNSKNELKKNIIKNNIINIDDNRINGENLQNNQIIMNNSFNSTIFFTFNLLINQIKKFEEQMSNFNILKVRGLQALLNPNNPNHYLLNELNNNNFVNYNHFIENRNNNKKKEKSQDVFMNKINYLKNNEKDNVKFLSKISEKNIINLKAIESGEEKRTVVRLSPVPPNYSSFDISKLLDKYLGIQSQKNQRIYQALYTPLCKVIGKNLGYCFVMMVKPEYVIQFYKTFNGLNFNKKKCKKNCQVIWANIQGKEFLKNADDPLRSPIIFKDIKID